jgi:valyl-tRNA synthetase
VTAPPAAQSDRPELPKTYDHAAVESRRYAVWETSGVFHEDPDPARPPFIIPMPPPNITGRAHLGHGSTYTAMDLLTRYHRMRGENADWLPGQDHAAIATEAVLVRELAREGKTRDGLGRAAFLERAWQWRNEYGGIIYEQFRKLGFGPDWARDRFTLDPGLSAAVTKVFVDLYNEGLIYRGTRLINWDPKARSTLSDAEVEYEERDASLWHVSYALEDASAAIVVATTRPETMLGDTAVAVHPEDPRYRSLIGKRVVLPLAGRTIPLIADAGVDPAFGTGAVKVTPAHDPLDYEIGMRHGLPMPTVIGFDGRIRADGAGFLTPDSKYVGLDRFEARAAIVADLDACGALVRTEPYRQRIARSSRTHEIIEPLLSLQWFCRMEPLAAPALEAYRGGRVRFVPERHGKTYERWLENIRDWNISRQVWWGHQLPVWYVPPYDDEHIIVAHSEEEARAIARERFGTEELRRDTDTLDTWFSSGLWPFSILGWPERTPELEHWYPAQLLITASEIIFLWVARMVMLGLRFMGDVPFRDVLITPIVFDELGRKMSKSLGNSIDPLELIARYGADATRFGIVRQMHADAQDLNFSESRCDEAAKFNNKIWNALRYVVTLPEGLPPAGTLPAEADRTLADRWILSALHEAISKASAALDRYDLGAYAETLLHFIWYEYCAWYLEATKLPAQTATRGAVLSYVLNAAMRALHPVAPFVSEEVWQALPHDGATIVTASWPESAEIPRDEAARERFEAVMRTVEKARNERASSGLAPQKPLQGSAQPPLDEEERALIALLGNADVKVLPVTANFGSADLSAADKRGSADLWARVVFFVPETIRRERLQADLTKLEAEVRRAEGKLANEAFVAKARPEAVDKEREKLAQYSAQLDRARAELRELSDAG